MKKNPFFCFTDYYDGPPSEKDNILKKQFEAEALKNKLLTKMEIVDKMQLYNIPIVFHIVYHESVQNIEKNQILKQMYSLNIDFRNKNIDNILFNQYPIEKNLATDSKINFILAHEDEKGNPTDGIVRKHTERDFFQAYEESGPYSLKEQPIKSSDMGGSDAWNTDKYLNVWVCKLSCPGGYAQYPRTDRTRDQCLTDGVVIDYRYFGIDGITRPPRNKGRTLTHELGHWLNLYHLWGRSNFPGCHGDVNCYQIGDELCDTPPQYGMHCGCPTGQTSSQKCPGCKEPLVLNFMDNWDDECALMFTQEQVNRMRWYLGNVRCSVIK